jgi:hypothetical protein
LPPPPNIIDSTSTAAAGTITLNVDFTVPPGWTLDLGGKTLTNDGMIDEGAGGGIDGNAPIGSGTYQED